MLVYDNIYNPNNILHYFEVVSAIPRPSGKEEAISNYILAFAKHLGLEVYQDAAFNVLIKKSATSGYEEKAPVILQGHLDMVAEKLPDSSHDFERDPLELVIHEDWLSANGTTLGADNGVAIAYGLALLASNDIPHPPLEVVFTTEEETTMNGAASLDMSLVRGKRLINLDMNDEDVIVLGSAGGKDYTIEYDIERQKPCQKFTPFRLALRGLLGGHSGEDIHKGRHNAILLLSEITQLLMKRWPLELVHIRGGNFSNAIPREAYIQFYTMKEFEPQITSFLEELCRGYAVTFGTTDHVPELILTPLITADYPMKEDMAEQLLTFLTTLPTGPLAFSEEIETLVIASNNVGVIYSSPKKVLLRGACRGASDTLVNECHSKMEALTQKDGVTLEWVSDYPAWSYESDSHLRNIAATMFLEQFGKEPSFEVIHAGLEVGYFANQIDGLKAISIGPTVLHLHTTDERLSLSSYVKMWEYLKKVLEKL